MGTLFKKIRELFNAIYPCTLKKSNLILKEINAIYGLVQKNNLLLNDLNVIREAVQENNFLLDNFSKKLDAMQRLIDQQAGVYVEIKAITDTLACAEQVRSIDMLLREVSQNCQSSLRTTTEMSEAIQQAANERQRLSNVYSRKMQTIQLLSAEASRAANEGLWAAIYRSTVEKESDWLKDRAFSPGRMAIGFPYLYILFRVLDEFRPISILETGMGQSTRMISQYAAAQENVMHYVVEDNVSWISFYKSSNVLPPNTEIILLETEMVAYETAEKVRVYKGFGKALAGKKFNLISIDAPSGDGMLEYSRIDILSILPECLADSFVILLDDCDRKPELNTANAITKALTDAGIPFKQSKVWGKKDAFIWCSEDAGFFTTL